MQLEGKSICHVKFGEGIIKEAEGKYITVLFQQGEKKFLYPDAFTNFLIMLDKKAQAKMDIILDGMITEEEKEREAEKKKQEQLHRIQSLKIDQNSQAAFGLIQNDRQNVFDSWNIFAGSYLTGKSKGEPKIPTNLKLNSACLLTECIGESEKTRRVVGAFMVTEDFDGSSCHNGIIKSHDIHRIKLNEDETVLFWDYMNTKDQFKWGRSEMKYISIKVMQSILKDLENKMEDSDRKNLMENFYEYYCFVNRLAQ
jgi:hypothetical protein